MVGDAAETASVEPEREDTKTRSGKSKLTTARAHSKYSTTSSVIRIQDKIVPIIMREKNKWAEITKELQKREINYTKAKLVGMGIQIDPETEDDYRRLYKYLKETKTEFHTFELTEKSLKVVVVKGVPNEIEEEAITEDLEKQTLC